MLKGSKNSFVRKDSFGGDSFGEQGMTNTEHRTLNTEHRTANTK
jgi:hypothetical protein